MTGIDIKHIPPIAEAARRLTDVVAGHVPVMFADAPAQALELVRHRPCESAGGHGVVQAGRQPCPMSRPCMKPGVTGS